MTRIPALLLLLAAAGLVPQARAETSTCTSITTLPTVISTQGVYCLKQDLSTAITTGSAITINTNNVTIDCNDFKIGGLGGGPNTLASGISAENRSNITVRNCNVRGFYNGVNLAGAAGGYHLVEKSRFDLNTGNGILLSGDGGTVRNNRVYDTGNSAGSVAGIQTYGAVDILDNSINNVIAKPGSGMPVYGILTNVGAGREISGNRISGLVAEGPVGLRLGIYNLNSAGLMIRGNSIYFPSPLTANDTGIRCQSAVPSASRDNILNNFAAPATAILNCHSYLDFIN